MFIITTIIYVLLIQEKVAWRSEHEEVIQMNFRMKASHRLFDMLRGPHQGKTH